MSLALFTYDFPHLKSERFLLRLWAEGADISCLIAAPRRQIEQPHPTVRVKPRHRDALGAKVFAERLNLPFVVMEHDDPTIADVLDRYGVEIGAVGGARILPSSTIAAVPKGILNLHPGMIPKVRGLDALKWSIYDDVVPGVTAHLIDERVDAGRIIIQEPIPVFPDDTFLDLSLRLEDKELQLLITALRHLTSRPAESFPLVEATKYNKRMTPQQEKETVARFPSWKSKYAGVDE